MLEGKLWYIKVLICKPKNNDCKLFLKKEIEVRNKTHKNQSWKYIQLNQTEGRNRGRVGGRGDETNRKQIARW